MTGHTESSHTSSIARSAGTSVFAVLVSRLSRSCARTGVCRVLRSGLRYDAFVVAFRIPNLLRDLFAEGALSAAFITVLPIIATNRGAASPGKTRQ